MLVLCTGMIRSGSTWSHNVCLNLMRAAFRPDSVSDGAYDESIENWRKFASTKINHAVLKCHGVDTPSLTWLAKNPEGVFFVYTFRDPRDVVASARSTYGLTVEQCIGAAQGSLWFLNFQRRVRSVCVVPYTSIVHGAEASIAAIAAYLGLALSVDDIRNVDRLCRREALPGKPGLVHQARFRAPGALDWPDLLDTEQLAQMAGIVAKWRTLFESDTVNVIDAMTPLD